MARCERPLVESLRSDPPHVGGAGSGEVPETALTAITVEALARLRSPSAQDAVCRGQAFLRRWQAGADTPAALDPARSLSGFANRELAALRRVGACASGTQSE